MEPKPSWPDRAARALLQLCVRAQLRRGVPTRELRAFAPVFPDGRLPEIAPEVPAQVRLAKPRSVTRKSA